MNKRNPVLMLLGTVVALTALMTAIGLPASAHGHGGRHHGGGAAVSTVYCDTCGGYHARGTCPNYCGDCEGYHVSGYCPNYCGNCEGYHVSGYCPNYCGNCEGYHVSGYCPNDYCDSCLGYHTGSCPTGYGCGGHHGGHCY